MSSIKIARINSQLVRTISTILLEEARDELMKTVTITGADTASDLSYAKIYFTSLAKIDQKAMEKEMNEAADFIRLEVAEKMDLRHTPKLKFIYDNSIEYGNKIEKKLQEIHKKDA